MEKFLTTESEIERSRIHAIARAASELRSRESEALAVLIANKVGKMIEG